ncbi:MAG: ABC transporter permease subunit [Clostridia bacterium]|nr:ABC transporter permease subunit [Clostridia bacterium]
MGKLLHAGFARLFKSKIFWIGIAALAGLAAFACIGRYRDAVILPHAGYNTPDGLLFIGAMYAPIWVPVFVSLFVGTEYSDGTMRNKVTVGHSRLAVYLSNVVVCTAGVLVMHLVYIGVMLGLGLPLLGGFVEISANVLVIFFFCSLATMVALTSVMVGVGMLIHSKATGAIVAMLLGLALLLGALSINQVLNAPEIITDGITVNEAGELVQVEPYRNPKYLAGGKRAFFQFLNECLPGNQMMTIGQSVALPRDVWHLPVYAVLLTVVVTLGGAYIFRRKDLK